MNWTGEDGITLDTDELAMAEWFEREQMPVEAEDLSLTNEMMMAFQNMEKCKKIRKNPLILQKKRCYSLNSVT